MRIFITLVSAMSLVAAAPLYGLAQAKAAVSESVAQVVDKTAGDAGATAAGEAAYRFGPGDKLRVRVYNEDTISGDYEVDSTGNLSLQLLGSVHASGLTLPELAALIEGRLLSEGYMINPRVAIDVLNYRPFYVLGEVNRPGSYPYVAGMTVLNAIALAGGYTYRAKQESIGLIRGDNQKKRKVSPNVWVLPGDIIKVEERFF